MKTPTVNKKQNVILRCDKTFKAQLHQLSEKRKTPMSELIRILVLKEYLNEYK